MAACQFYQNALRVSSENSWEKMARKKVNGLNTSEKNNLVSSVCSSKDVK